MLNSKCGIQQDKKDLGLSHKHIIKERWGFSWSMIALRKQLLIIFIIGSNKLMLILSQA
jgi:hypothetical protein